MEKDLVSVVIPVFNGERYLRAAIESVLSQAHRRLECIVIDDGSTDSSLALARGVSDERMRVLTGPNQGLAHARNLGRSVARGEYLAYLDADDLWRLEKLEKQLAAIQTNERVVALGSLMTYISAEGRPLGTAGIVVDESAAEEIRRADLMPFPMSSILFRTSVVEDVGGSDELLDHLVKGQAEDLDLLARVACAGEVVTYPEVLGDYRVHADSMSADSYALQRKAMRFVQARQRERLAGRNLSFGDFDRTYRPNLNVRRADSAARRFRLAGVEAAGGRKGRALLHVLLAGSLAPMYVLRRLLRQQARVGIRRRRRS